MRKNDGRSDPVLMEETRDSTPLAFNGCNANLTHLPPVSHFATSEE